MWPYPAGPLVHRPHQKAELFPEETDVGYLPAAPTKAIAQISTCEPKVDDRPVSAEFSLWLIRAFLPYRLQFHFFAEPDAFMAQLSLPPDDPKSVHPALLNAMYLAACWIVGDKLGSWQDYFLTQTRRHLQQSLAEADRLIHFLWATAILGSWYSLDGRMNEAYATVSGCARFSLACGLEMSQFYANVDVPQAPLLSPPADLTEFLERIRLSHAIYILDRTLAMVCGLPSMFAMPLPGGPKSDASAGMSERQVNLLRPFYVLMIPVFGPCADSRPLVFVDSGTRSRPDRESPRAPKS
ncbi:hypothetical protein DL93DRAFT_1919289 [Clavulina sp. PMI_390]|nr:hypothetical protein DL93DRAFT_1919289 [Clavulina sp. PMI_390]